MTFQILFADTFTVSRNRPSIHNRIPSQVRPVRIPVQLVPTTSTTSTTTTTPTTTTTTVPSSEASTDTKVDGIESYQEFDVVNVTTEITANKFAMRTAGTGEMGSILSGNLLIGILSVFAVLFTASIILTAVYFR